MILSCRKASWFSFPRSFPAGKRRGFPFHDPFLQESVVVFLSTILSCRKASWFSFPRSFPAGKRRGFPFHDPFLQESVVVFLSTILSCRKASWFPFPSGKGPQRCARATGNMVLLFLRSDLRKLFPNSKATLVDDPKRASRAVGFQKNHQCTNQGENPFQTLIAWPEH